MSEQVLSLFFSPLLTHISDFLGHLKWRERWMWRVGWTLKKSRGGNSKRDGYSHWREWIEKIQMDIDGCG
jgi:hypothetical protein